MHIVNHKTARLAIFTCLSIKKMSAKNMVKSIEKNHKKVEESKES